MRKWYLLIALIVVVLLVWFFVSPPRFWVNLTKRVEPTAAVGEQLVEKYGCRGCHRIGGVGSLAAPNLDNVVRRMSEEDPALVTIHLWLRNPKGVKPNTAMPNFHLSDTEIEAIVEYLKQASEASP